VPRRAAPKSGHKKTPEPFGSGVITLLLNGFTKQS